MIGSTIESKSPMLFLRALQHRNFRLYFGGQIVSLIGTWIQQVAVSWLVYRLTNSAFLLGAVSFATQVPSFVGTPFAGVMADRWNRHRVLIVTQSLAMLQALVLAALTLSGHITIRGILALNIFFGFVTAVDLPMRQSFMVDMIDSKDDLPNAIALNSMIINGARLLGPAIAGLMLAAMSEGVCFLVNAFSYIAVIAALVAMRLTPVKKEAPGKNMLEELREGFDYAFGFAPIRALLLLIALAGLTGMPYAVLMPIFAKEILHGGAHTMGFLMAAPGVGALTGSIFLATRKTVLGSGKRIAFAAAAFGIGLIVFSQSRLLWLSLAALVLAGFGMISMLATSNTVLQTIVHDDMRGRVMSFYTMSFMGVAPFGSVIAGSLAHRFGAPFTLTCGGLAVTAGAVWFGRQIPAMRKLVLPVYAQKGIVPEIASGLQAAARITLPPED